MRRPVLVAGVAAAVSLLLVRPAPAYDPWAWLLWGRQVLTGALDTREGPAFKPLPVAICTALAGAGSAAPWLWVLLARFGAALALALVWRLVRRLGGTRWAAAVATLGVALCAGFLGDAAAGMSEGLLIALALAARELARAGRARCSVLASVACGLLRVETWPFLAVAAAIGWRRRRGVAWRVGVAGAAIAVPAAWLLPELAGSGNLLRSAARATVPNPGQPALADVPALASLRAAALVPLAPLWAGLPALAVAWRRRDRFIGEAVLLGGVGLAWIGLVAVMAQMGFSGEPRYALPGAALLGVAGAIGLDGVARTPARRPFAGGADVVSPRPAPTPLRATSTAATAAVLVASVLVAVAAAPRAGRLADLRREQAYQWRLQTELGAAIERAGGRAAVLACGRPFVGPLRGPLFAYRLGVPKRLVEPDAPPQAPGVVFRSALTPADAAAPAVPPGFHRAVELGLWQVFSSCAR